MQDLRRHVTRCCSAWSPTRLRAKVVWALFVLYGFPNTSDFYVFFCSLNLGDNFLGVYSCTFFVSYDGNTWKIQQGQSSILDTSSAYYWLLREIIYVRFPIMGHMVILTHLLMPHGRKFAQQVAAFMVGGSILAWYHARQSHGMYHRLNGARAGVVWRRYLPTGSLPSPLWCQSRCSVAKVPSMTGHRWWAMIDRKSVV